MCYGGKNGCFSSLLAHDIKYPRMMSNVRGNSLFYREEAEKPHSKNTCAKTWTDVHVHEEAHFNLAPVASGRRTLGPMSREKHGLSAEGLIGGKLLIIQTLK